MGKMKLTILGSGTFVPELNRTCTSFLLEDEGEKIVFDFGRGVIERLLELKISLYEIDKIFISHMHVDHFSDLFPFIHFILFTPNKDKLKLPYKIYGPKGIKQIFDKIFDALYPDGNKNLDRIGIKDIFNGEEINFRKLKIKGFKVEHSQTHLCFGYQIIKDDKKICYSGDTKNCETLREYCKNSDLAIIEATGPPELKLDGHLTGEEVGQIAKESKIKKLIIVHVAGTYLTRVKKDIQKNFKGEIIIAKDLMEVEI